jgi:hypothetical protein
MGRWRSPVHDFFAVGNLHGSDRHLEDEKVTAILETHQSAEHSTYLDHIFPFQAK